MASTLPNPISIVKDSFIFLFGESEPGLYGSVAAWRRGPEVFYRDHTLFFTVIPIFYLLFVYFGQIFMEKRKPLALRSLWTYWNLFMFVFSAIGTYHTLYAALEYTFTDEWVCSTNCYHRYSTPARWVFLFNVSKVLEFIDTIFLVLQKRPVIFLHWYHHVITYLFCWYSNQQVHYYTCNGYLFCTMNYFVHTFMYGYYLLRSLRVNLPKGTDFCITVLQIVQMILGVAAVVKSSTCKGADMFGVMFGFAIYFSFFVLFVKIFLERYFGSEATPKPAAAKPLNHDSTKAAESTKKTN